MSPFQPAKKSFTRLTLPRFFLGAALSAIVVIGNQSIVRQAHAQYSERPSLPGGGLSDVDISGRSIKAPRIRAISSRNKRAPGTTAWLFAYDPFLAYQLGRNLNYREFRARDGVFGKDVANHGGLRPDGTTSRITANNHTSCLGCHNLPNGNPGGGANFSKDSGRGRNTPHYYGAGLVEMLALQIRTDILLQIDSDGDGWVSVAEARQSPRQIYSNPTINRQLSFGSTRLNGGRRGTPMLNPIFKVWYGARNSRGVVVPVPGATEIDGRRATHYNFQMTVWGWGQGGRFNGLNPTNRAFFWDPLIAHSGLESYDPSTTYDPDRDGVSAPTLAGAVQFPALADDHSSVHRDQ